MRELDTLNNISKVLPVLLLDKIIGPRSRKVIGYILGGIVFLLLLLSVVVRLGSFDLPVLVFKYLSYIAAFLSHFPGVSMDGYGLIYVPLLPSVDVVQLPLVAGLGRWNALLLTGIFLYLCCKLIDLFARSHYYRGAAILERNNRKRMVSFPVQRIVAEAKHGDLLSSLVNDPIGNAFFMRLGVTRDEVLEILVLRGDVTDYRTYTQVEEVASFHDLIHLLFSNKFLREWVLHKGILVDDILIAADWVEHDYNRFVSFERWWGLEAFARIRPIGESFAFGHGFRLKQFSTEVTPGPVEYSHRYGGKDVELLEENLARSDTANALIISQNLGLAEDLILEFAKDIAHIAHSKAFNHKRCYYFDVSLFGQSVQTSAEFESTLQEVLFDAKRVGNVIFVISNLPLLFLRAVHLGADISGVLRPYIESSSLQVVALSDVYQYHSVLSGKTDLVELFHEMHIETPEGVSLLKKIQDEALAIEAQYDFWFSVGAIRQIIKDAERTLVHGILPDRTREILLAIGPYLSKEQIKVVLPSHIDTFVSIHANMPMGSTSSEEEVRLLGLETLLHQSIVGQHDAVAAVAQALRRSRLGIRNERKPIASFLFFGPTGVGKTEVAKTLAKVFFGGEDKFLRFDMSEFSKESGLVSLVGSHELGEGLLTASLREHPYGVLLLDEFEKSSRSVQDLFLQILDEGVFHDALGQPVNCKNLIIVATSNAGASDLHQKIAAGAIVDEAFRKNVISNIIEQNIFRPELLNRFDGLVLFQPLSLEMSKQIARLMLEKLARQLLEKKIVLVINDVLVNVVVEKGVDPAFGARPMQRVIQDVVEEKISQKILGHEIGEGVPLEFKEGDFK